MTVQWLKYFRFWFVFAEIFVFFRVPRSIILFGVKFGAVSYCSESSLAQYHTARSQVLHSIILPRVKFRAVSYCSESIIKICGKSSAQYHTVRSQVPCSIILRGVMQQSLRGKLRAVSCCEKSSSLQYHTARSHATELEGKAPHSMILRRTWLPAVSYCAESLYTAQSQQLLLETFAQALMGQCHKNKYIFRLC